jgi:hypothetical protein
MRVTANRLQFSKWIAQRAAQFESALSVIDEIQKL